MYLRITRARFDPSQSDPVLALVPELYAAVDRRTGEGMVLSTWDTEAHANHSCEHAGRLTTVIQRFMALGVQMDPPRILARLASYQGQRRPEVKRELPLEPLLIHSARSRRYAGASPISFCSIPRTQEIQDRR